MRFIDDVVLNLSARLPELEWKLRCLGSLISSKRLPRGLFREQSEFTTRSCIDEIKNDLTSLKNQTNERSAHYLAERVNQKISVLVKLCQIQMGKQQPERQVQFGVHALSTRQQWLQTLVDEIAQLSEEQQALSRTFLSLQALNNASVVLSVQVELGEAERRLTLAKEALARATRY